MDGGSPYDEYNAWTHDTFLVNPATYPMVSSAPDKPSPIAAGGTAFAANASHAAGAAPAAAHGRAPALPAHGRRQDLHSRAISGLARESMRTQILDYLQQQYTELALAILGIVNKWNPIIDKLKEVEPKDADASTLIKGLVDTVNNLAVIAFPEYELAKIAVEGVGKAVEAAGLHGEANEAKALSKSKMQAKKALLTFATNADAAAKSAKSALQARVDTALDNFTPPADFEETIAAQFHKYVRDFAMNELGIRIGNDVAPGTIENLTRTLNTQVGKWLEDQFVEEQEAKYHKKEGMLSYGDGPEIDRIRQHDERDEYNAVFVEKVVDDDN